jgi:hypothetical protein
VGEPAVSELVVVLLAFSEQLNVFHLTDVFVACLDQFGCFFDIGCCFAHVVVVFEGYELGVDQCVLDVLVA